MEQEPLRKMDGIYIYFPKRHNEALQMMISLPNLNRMASTSDHKNQLFDSSQGRNWLPKSG